jgi:hypothetical protein
MNKNPQRNASGCMDMTAFQAIRNADRDMTKKKHKEQRQFKAKPALKNITTNTNKTEEFTMKSYINVGSLPSEAKIANQRIDYVALDECVPTKYQRVTSDGQVEDIVNGFDDAKVNVLTVSLREGKYHIVDGLHRSKALKDLGITHALCIVLTGLTYEQEADYFRKQNINKRNILTFDDFKAGLEAKDEVCLKINDILKANEFQIGKGGFYKIASIHALFTIVKDYGYKTLDDTLCMLANTWSSIPKASSSEFLLGAAEFVSRYGIAEFAERMKEKYAVIFFEYTEAMRVRGYAGSVSSRKKFCRILVEHYNKGFGSNNKKRLKWEE